MITILYTPIIEDNYERNNIIVNGTITQHTFNYTFQWLKLPQRKTVKG